MQENNSFTAQTRHGGSLKLAAIRDHSDDLWRSSSAAFKPITAES